MLNFQLSQSAAELLIFCPQPSHLANQIANNANQVRVREPFQRIRDARCHPKIESYFRGLDSPARKSAPVTTATIYVIVDLDYPRVGFIPLDFVDQALMDVLAGMK